MRRLTSKQEEKRKQKRKQTIVGIVLIGVLVMSVFGIFINSFGQNANSQGGGDSMEYNGYRFINQDNLWYLQLSEDQQFAFTYNPPEVESMMEESSVSVQGKIKALNDYANEPLYIYSEEHTAKSEIYRNLYNHVLRSQDACPGENITKKYPELENPVCENNWPEKNCNDNFIIIKPYENNSEKQPEIIQDNNCLIIKAEEGEKITKLTDEALLKIIGIK